MTKKDTIAETVDLILHKLKYICIRSGKMKIAGIIEPEDEHIIHVFSNTQFSRELLSEYKFRKGYELMMKLEMEEQYDRT